MATSTHFIELLSMWILDYMQGIWGARHAAISAACPPPRHAGRHSWRRLDKSGRRSYHMFIMLITCQSLFKKDDEVVACVASAEIRKLGHVSPTTPI